MPFESLTPTLSPVDPMQPMFNLLVYNSSGANCSEEDYLHLMLTPKRFGVYLPSTASSLDFIDTKTAVFKSPDVGDDWRFSSGSSVLSSPSRYTNSTLVADDHETPRKPRTENPEDRISLFTEDTQSMYTSDDELLDPGGETVGDEPFEALDDEELGTMQGVHHLKPIYRQSRHDALVETFDEAIALMDAQGRQPSDRLPCPRPDCHDTLANVQALMYHLHIHNIDDGLLACPRCKGLFEGRRGMDGHVCRKRQLRPFSTSQALGSFTILSGVQRAITKFLR